MVWITNSEVPKYSLSQIMSEEMVNSETMNDDRDLQMALELSKAESEDVVPIPHDDDELLARLLQKEIDSHDEESCNMDLVLALQLQEEEQRIMEDGHSRVHPVGKISIVLANDIQEEPLVNERLLYTADDAEMIFEEIRGKDMPVVSKPRKAPWPVRNKNLKGQGGNDEISTKHDKSASEHSNLAKANVLLPSGAKSGDLNHRLSNQVYNSLQHGWKKQNQVAKGGGKTVERDSIQTHAKGLDYKSRLILYGMINSHFLEEVHGVVKTGKEAVVFHAIGKATEIGQEIVESLEQNEEMKEMAIKVFKTTLTGFKNRLDFVKGDHRFQSLSRLSNQNPRKIVTVWAEKELRNLSRVHKCGIPCPAPFKLFSNILVMEFIGRDGIAAPQLKNRYLSNDRIEKCYVQVILGVQAMLSKCKLVHADLSEYNILYMDRICYFIDFGQAVLLDHPRSLDFLKMDCANITRFFVSRGLEDPIPVDLLIRLLLESVDFHSIEFDQEEISFPQRSSDSNIQVYASNLGSWVDAKFAATLAGNRFLEDRDLKHVAEHDF